MKFEHETTIQRAMPNAHAFADHAGHDASTVSHAVAESLKGLESGAPRFLATAPGRLDVMSGLADFSGALVLQMPLAEHVCLAAQTRQDGMVTLATVPDSDRPEGLRRMSVGSLVEASRVAAQESQRAPPFADVRENDAHCVRNVWGVLIEMLRRKIVDGLGGGLTLVLGSTMGGLSDIGTESATAAATLAAVARAMNATPEPVAAAEVCRRAINDWLALPVGISETFCSLFGEAHAVTQLQCDPCTFVGALRLPESLELVGVHCGSVNQEWRVRYERARTAACMGRLLIDRIVRHEGGNHASWDGRLARVSVADFVERFRNRLPTKLKGSEFHDRFGETGDPLTRIQPDVVYKIRSRTEHHIYENARANEFVECLARWMRTGEDGELERVRDLMHASHWSYGQRSGLGSVETDLLTNLIRQHGREIGIIGSRISGRGCGGVVTVLLKATKEAHAALHSAIEDYEQKTGKSTTLLRGSLPGALTAGVRQL